MRTDSKSMRMIASPRLLINKADTTSKLSRKKMHQPCNIMYSMQHLPEEISPPIIQNDFTKKQ